MHEKKKCISMLYFGSEVVFYTKQGLSGLLSVVVSVPGILCTYLAPGKPFCLIANLPYYVF